MGLHVMTHVAGMQGKEPEIIESLAKYVTDEYQNKCQETVDTSEWPRRYNVCISVLTDLQDHFYRFSYHVFTHVYGFWTCNYDDMASIGLNAVKSLQYLS